MNLPNVVLVMVLGVAEGVTKVMIVGVPPLVAGCTVVRPVEEAVKVSKTGSTLNEVTKVITVGTPPFDGVSVLSPVVDAVDVIVDGTTKVITVGVPPLVAGCNVVTPVVEAVIVSNTGSILKEVTSVTTVGIPPLEGVSVMRPVVDAVDVMVVGITKVIMVGVPPLVAGCNVVRPVVEAVMVSKTGSKLSDVTKVTTVAVPPDVAG